MGLSWNVDSNYDLFHIHNYNEVNWPHATQTHLSWAERCRFCAFEMLNNASC